VIPAFISAAMNQEPLPVHGDGSQSRDFTYVDSVVDVIADALIRRVSHDEPVNLAFGTRVTLLELIADLEEIVARPLPVEFLPARVGDVPTSQADSSTLVSLFPDLEPKGLSESLRATVDWFESARP
jgi:UDP-glucose 4-epimerase